MPQITQLDNDPTPNNNDLLVTVDMAAGTTKNISREQFFTGAPLPANTVDSQAIAAGAVVPAKLGLPGCLVLRSSQNITSSTSPSTISFNSSPFNEGAMYSSGSPTRVTASVGGLYQVSASIIWSATNSGGRRTFQVRVNGSVVASQDDLIGMNFVIGQSISLMVNLAPGDYIDMQVAQTSGGTLSADNVRLGVALINA